MTDRRPFAETTTRNRHRHSWQRVIIRSALSLVLISVLSLLLGLMEPRQDGLSDPPSATPTPPKIETPEPIGSPTTAATLVTGSNSYVTMLAPSTLGPSPAPPGATSAPPVADRVSAYRSIDFLSDYLTNATYPIILDGQPWDSGSVDILRLREPGGGTSYWDYWSDLTDWGIENHQWRDEQGKWHTYGTETIQDTSGRTVSALVLVDRQGPGVMDRLWFTNDAVTAISGITNPSNPSELTEWGNLAKLGKLRIDVDAHTVFDGPIQSWFSGEAQRLPESIRKLLVWHYRTLGANGNMIPIPYQESLKVYLYGGEKEPKWFMATGTRLPTGTRVQPYSQDSLPLDRIAELAANVTSPEDFIKSEPNMHYALFVQPSSPALVGFSGSGTITAIQLRVGKEYDPRDLELTIRYGVRVGFSVPLLAFFTEPGRLVYHRSTPIGVVDAGDSNVFYSNLPMPFQDGIGLELSTNASQPIPVEWQVGKRDTSYNTELRVLYTPFQQLQVYGPDYVVHLNGNGKVVGLVFDSQDQRYGLVPHIRAKDPNKDDIDKIVFPMGYLEGNLTLMDGTGNSRYYSGQEDWAEGGYYFNLGYTTPPGGGNLPFAGLFRYRGGTNGYASFFRYFGDLSAFRYQNGLDLLFGHGTYRNNFPVSYSTVVFYYLAMPGTP